ncbi:MAG: hypothetical protein GY756_10810 [bacterium]|nr:hypothetical protein [bacterium]
MPINQRRAEERLSQIKGQWDCIYSWKDAKDEIYTNNESQHPNCTMLVGYEGNHKYYTFKNRESFNLHPYDFLYNNAPVLKYIRDKAKEAGDSIARVLPMFSYNAESIILAGASANKSVLMKINAEIDFKCLDSLTSENLQQEIKSGKLKASIENKYSSIFNNVDIDLSNLNDISLSFGVNFKVLGASYKISCKPVLVTGVINIYSASGSVSKSVQMEIGGHPFEVDIISGYEVVIESYKGLIPSAPLLPIPDLVHNFDYFTVKPVTVGAMHPAWSNSIGDNSNIANRKITWQDSLNDNSSIANNISNQSANLPTWSQTIKSYINFGELALVTLLISQNPHGTNNLRFTSNLKPATAATIITSVVFSVIISSAEGLAFALI